MSINILNVLVCSSSKNVGFLSNSHAPITDNESLENKPYFSGFINQPCRSSETS